ncbi:protein kinase family protein [Marinobacter confluentis]|uniref:Lipopolysaccharide kinase n=1 Tax=Marinobacter confluentis TaxID=1697557 RepID=A0A4Z1C5M6_9GAMM|nr:hypothetical protein [Marinobacter confluentis]TGN38522.1 hypothetical protein E5Q11_15255 [Marinobacter confluentis]
MDIRSTEEDQNECRETRIDSWHLLYTQEDDKARAFLTAYLAEGLQREQTFRDNWRTLSAQIRFENESLLLKIPRARNGRRWERLLSFFRGSDAVRSFRQLQLMPSLGLDSPQPVIAGEARRRGFVVDSFLCYRFVDARRAEKQDAPLVLKAILRLHSQGYLRSDAQLANFLIRPDGSVVFIDFRLKKPRILSGLSKAKELDRFFRSCPEARADYANEEKVTVWLMIARYLGDFEFATRALKRRLRNKKRL